MSRKQDLMKSLDEDEAMYLTDKMSRTPKGTPTIAQLTSFKVGLKCKNKKQKDLHKLIQDKEIVFCQGSAGTGKSYIATETALELLKNGGYNKIIICCPNVESSSMPIGLLPGTIDEKMQPYMDAIEFTIQKILDESGNMNSSDILSTLLKNDIIREEAVSFLRGKTFDNSIIIVDEAENLNKQETLLILSRIGRNSKMIFLGDNQQIDRRDIKKSKDKCGLDFAFEVLQDIDEIGFLQFTEEDIVRNPIISKIIKRWNGIENEQV